MRQIYLVVFIGIFAVSIFAEDLSKVKRTNNYPIVLVHGFTGWGPDELLGYKYWGGTALDIEKYLNKKNYRVETATVGPISSNHDRACELFYQIKGGTVDYGADHCKAYNHDRKGRNFKALYSEWSEENPVHLVGHSMGGQTSRLLVELLAKDYFGIGTNEKWVKSVTTISTPHNGTTLATMIDSFSGGLAEEIISMFLALAGTDWYIYDFKLDQWGLKPKKDETLSDFLQRVDDTVGSTKDISMHDLLPKGAKELNGRVRDFADVYYFSYATEETYVLLSTFGYEWAEPGMTPIMWAFAYYMGHYKGDHVVEHKEWWKNDGIVNTTSMKGPSTSKIVNYDGTPQKGVWNYVKLIDSKDHVKVVGHYQDPIIGAEWLKELYVEIADRLYKLP
ncbi:esterase/lipase family protein [Candidatus Uabimicrobium amorphum]|uniref:triacylglycerol lipase n=1 Tax=Uabimicrobium amorphum TaxID=2596890 RepID=A0A5S9IJ32_UABAM|nr:lipase [Candidatus Uabimicrobium amorphum]BBM81980.1 lipase [Candidatus Uabimicrobium amorphum]